MQVRAKVAVPICLAVVALGIGGTVFAVHEKQASDRSRQIGLNDQIDSTAKSLGIKVPSSSPAKGKSSSALSDWYYGKGGHSNVQAVQSDSRDVKDAANSSNISDLQDACQRLTLDANTALSNPPPVNADVYKQAMNAYVGGGLHCATGIVKSDYDKAKLGGTEIGSGNTLLAKVVNDFEDALG